ncbi:MAG: sugar O-acetyltransferase [Blautia sp.]|nr:sugar O-acetyltransferase [Blautia sp.]
MTNAERRDKELAYVADSEVFGEMVECKKKLKKMNSLDSWEYEKVNAAAKEVLPYSEELSIIPPFYCEYGTHIKIGKNFFANYNCVMIDVAQITIGDDCLLGPSVSIYTAGHPLHPKTRASGYEYGKSVTIGDRVWIGGGVIIVPGVHIGHDVVIGAGSVVTKDIPDMVVAAGNPCRVIRKITEDDRRKLFKEEEIDEEAWQKITANDPK